jgi:hypothetical protein
MVNAGGLTWSAVRDAVGFDPSTLFEARDRALVAVSPLPYPMALHDTPRGYLAVPVMPEAARAAGRLVGHCAAGGATHPALEAWGCGGVMLRWSSATLDVEVEVGHDGSVGVWACCTATDETISMALDAAGDEGKAT